MSEVRTLFRSGCCDVNCLNKSWEEPLTCLQTSHNYVTGHYLPWGQVPLQWPAAVAETDWRRVKSNRSSDYEDIDIYDWFAHYFVYESNLEKKEKIIKWIPSTLLVIDFERWLPADSHLIHGCENKKTIVEMQLPHYPLCLMGGKTLTPSQSVSWVLRDPYFWRLTGCWWFSDYSIFWKRSFP